MREAGLRVQQRSEQERSADGGFQLVHPSALAGELERVDRRTRLARAPQARESGDRAGLRTVSGIAGCLWRLDATGTGFSQLDSECRRINA